MSKLLEIEAAVESLPMAEKRVLLAWLQSEVERGRTGARDGLEERKVWLSKLAERRRRGSTGKTGAPLQQVLDEIRGDG